jgi:hypothetical protein
MADHLPKKAFLLVTRISFLMQVLRDNPREGTPADLPELPHCVRMWLREGIGRLLITPCILVRRLWRFIYVAFAAGHMESVWGVSDMQRTYVRRGPF